MNSESKLHFIVTMIILGLAIFNLQLAWVRADPINPDATTCGGTDVCRLPSNVETFEINCNCSASGGQCSWVTFADRGRVLSNGSLLSWNKSTIGYGQFICVGSSNDATTIRNVLILPEASYVTCDGCIDATVCRDATGSYFFQFLKHFDQSNTPCEIEFPNGTLVPNVILMEGKCVELPANSNYSILCPICPGDLYTIYYTVLFSNIEDCSNDICSHPSPTIIATSVIELSATMSPSLAPSILNRSTVLIIPTSSGTSSKDNCDGNNTGVIVGITVAIMVVLAMVVFAILCIAYIHRNKKNTGMRFIHSKIRCIKELSSTVNLDTNSRTDEDKAPNRDDRNTDTAAFIRTSDNEVAKEDDHNEEVNTGFCCI